jgi:hypothetical protein
MQFSKQNMPTKHINCDNKRYVKSDDDAIGGPNTMKFKKYAVQPMKILYVPLTQSKDRSTILQVIMIVKARQTR